MPVWGHSIIYPDSRPAKENFLKFHTLQNFMSMGSPSYIQIRCDFTADVRQPWTNPHDLHFEYLIIRFDYLIIPFDYSIIGSNIANL